MRRQIPLLFYPRLRLFAVLDEVVPDVIVSLGQKCEYVVETVIFREVVSALQKFECVALEPR